MTDKEKLASIKENVLARCKSNTECENNAAGGRYYAARADEDRELLSFIDSLQEEPVKDRFAFKAIPRLLDMIEPSDRAKAYITKLADTLEVEGYSTDAKIVRESLKMMNGEKVPMATMDEEPVSVWHNMDEVPIKGEVILVQTKDTFYGVSVQKGGTTYKNRNKDRYVRWAYASDLLNLSNVERTIKNWKEPVSEDLEEVAKNHAVERYKATRDMVLAEKCKWSFKAGAEWNFERIKEALLSKVLPYFMHGGEADEVVAKLDEVLNQK